MIASEHFKVWFKEFNSTSVSIVSLANERTNGDRFFPAVHRRSHEPVAAVRFNGDWPLDLEIRKMLVRGLYANKNSIDSFGL